ncbi:hypothetical protein LTR66_017658, partial [Elasticomyces elasticus]
MSAVSQTSSPERERHRANTAMSHVSHRTRRSSQGVMDNIDLTETSEEKKKLHGKSYPTKALQELQPAAVAQQESLLEDIRQSQYKDREDNIISDPDRSNPTRSRMERPLATIQGFNDAAEGTTSRRTSYQRPQPQYTNDSNRPRSYYGEPNHSNNYGANRGSQRSNAGGYYRNSSYGMRPDSLAEEGVQGPPPPRHQRFQSAPYMPNESPSSIHSQQQYDAMTSGSDEMSKSTNPSSQNSSFDQLHQMHVRKPDENGNYPYQHPQQGGQRGPQHRQFPPQSMHNGHHNG